MKTITVTRKFKFLAISVCAEEATKAGLYLDNDWSQISCTPNEKETAWTATYEG